MTPVTWLDALLVLLVVATTALGASRRLAGLTVGVGAVLLLRPLLVVGSRDLWVAIVAALLGGVLLAVIGQRLAPTSRRQGWGGKAAGGVGGALLGVALLLALVTSLPIQRNPANEHEVFYPPRTAPGTLAVTLNRSPLVGVGRTILLHPLLPAPTPAETRAASAWRVYGALHDWLVVGQPWNEEVRGRVN